jgi:hypothetical protein
MLTMMYSERVANGRRTLDRLAAHAAVGLLACLLSLAAAWLLFDHRGVLLVYGGLVLGVLGLIAAHNRGAAAAVAVIAILNGIPFLDVERYASPGVFRPADLIFMSLLAVLLVGGLRGLGRLSKELKLIWAWGFVFIAWWLFTLLRTALFEDVPLLQAGLYGRDFLYFAILLPIFATTVRKQRELVGFVAVICAGAAWHSLGTVATVVFGLDSSWLVHPIQTTEYAGLTRIYAYMTEAAIFAIPLGAGLVLLAARPALRWAGGAVLALSAAGVLVQFGRMLYYSLALGLLAAVFLWVIRPAARATPVRTAVAALAPIAAVGFVILLATGGIQVDRNPDSAVAAVAQRAASGFEEISTGTGTLGYRQSLTDEMEDLLEGHWVEGLGFLHPAAHPVAGLPDLSIRNSDVGVFNALMTIGLVGTALLYAPFLVVLWALIRRSRSGHVFEWEWLAFGGVAWIVTVVVGSITLVALFSVPGLVFAGCILACVVRMLDSSEAPRALGSEP